jgi:hypothetical protein
MEAKMRGKIVLTISLLAVLVFVSVGPSVAYNALSANLNAPVALSTGFTYQGQLEKDGNPVSGNCDFRFILYDAEVGGSQVGTMQEKYSVGVTAGLFTIPNLDFGSSVFTGNPRWIETSVKCSGDTSYIPLPRQALTAAPYAHYAVSSGALQGYTVSTTPPTLDQVLKWNGSMWAPTTNQPTNVNRPPVAVLQADSPVIYLGEDSAGSTTLRLSSSYDPDGDTLTFAFDSTGQTIGLPSSYSSASSFAANYNSTGNYLAAGWVRDSNGTFALARAMVSVYRFGSIVVDSSGDVGRDASLAAVNGYPAIAYEDWTNRSLKYRRALDANGTSWANPVTLYTAPADLIAGPSMAIVNGRPAVAFHNTNNSLTYVCATDANGVTWNAPVTVDSAGNYWNFSLAVVNGRPAIAYYNYWTLAKNE